MITASIWDLFNYDALAFNVESMNHIQPNFNQDFKVQPFAFF